MPLYDFRCADCGREREVRAPLAMAGSLELVCLDCGGAMTKALSRTAAVVVRSRGEAAPSPSRRGLPRADTCSDGAVKLTRPNPFKKSLPHREEDR